MQSTRVDQGEAWPTLPPESVQRTGVTKEWHMESMRRLTEADMRVELVAHGDGWPLGGPRRLLELP